MTPIGRSLLLLSLTVAVGLGCDRERAPTVGAASPDELKESFLRCYRTKDVDGIMSLYYLQGASARMIKMYRGGVPDVDKMPLTSAKITDLPADDRDAKMRFTLVREKLLVLEFDATKQSVREQSFHIGRHEGRYFFTLPAGD